MTTRVFLLDDHEIVRRGLRELFDAEDDLKVVGEAGTARIATSGRSAPTKNARADDRAAAQGLARSSRSMPSSKPRWARRASRSVGSSATTVAVSPLRPR
jgi:hypothetical protein